MHCRKRNDNILQFIILKMEEKNMDEKKKKLIYKKIRFWVIILILIALIGGTSGYKKQKIKRLKNMLNQMLKYQ
jgi:hypothetical protein